MVAVVAVVRSWSPAALTPTLPREDGCLPGRAVDPRARIPLVESTSLPGCGCVDVCACVHACVRATAVAHVHLYRGWIPWVECPANTWSGSGTDRQTASWRVGGSIHWPAPGIPEVPGCPVNGGSEMEIHTLLALLLVRVRMCVCGLGVCV